ncbi:MAG: PIN domain-containing protein [Bacteroidia bacterium]|nr:PIN domain-containing protein [Bacteroidia bacterium]
MIKIFADTDVCLDLLSGRKPYNSFAEKIFSLADNGKVKIFVSSISFANINYILRSQYSSSSATRRVIAKFKTLVATLSVDSKTIDIAIASDFNDFEDAIQYYTAIEENITTFITRNIKDYKKAHIKIMTPETFLSKHN